MKSLIMWVFIGLFVSTFSYACHIKLEPKASVITIDSTAYFKAKCDSLQFLAASYEKHLIAYENERVDMIDSIAKLNNRPIMTASQFLELYKYERLLKYYKICKNKPSQWKYYKGWSIRVFEL